MGTTLTGKRVQNTYDSLLKITDNDNLTGVPKRITSGLGTDSPIFLSTDKIGIGMSPTVQFQTSGDAEIGNNLVVGGNLTVNGTTTFIDSTIVEIGDNMIELAKDNTANTKDIGWYGTINDGSEKYVGVFYDASTGTTTPEFKIGIGTAEPGNTALWTTKGKLIIGDIDSTGGTFSGHITIPETPTADGHAASKKYVDDNTSGSETAERIQITVKNVSGATLSKGVVVHVSPSASPPSGNVVEVIKADYDDADKMPAIGILKESIANENEGTAVMFGALSGVDTSSFSAGDELYVGNDGALTNTKPTATSQLIQKIGVCVKSHASNGLIKIFGAGRSNDVPNQIARDIQFTDNSKLSFGNSNDLQIFHNFSGGDGIIKNNTGDLYIENTADDKNIRFTCDNGSGGTQIYFELQGVSGGTNPFTVFPDNSFLVFGNGHDLRIYHDTNHSYIEDTGTGDLRLKGDYVKIIAANNETMLSATQNGAVELYHNNSKKLETTSSGIKVTSEGYQINIEDGSSGNISEILTSNTAMGFFADRADAVASTSMIFSIDNSTKMTIDSSGNVGIGTTSPNYKLDVNGSLRGSSNVYAVSTYAVVLDSNSGAGPQITFGSTSDFDQYGRIAQHSSKFQFFTYNRNFEWLNNTTSLMTLQTNGNLGIGTTSPNAKLDILGTSSDQLRLRTAETEEYKIGRNASTGYLDFTGTQANYTGYLFSGTQTYHKIQAFYDGSYTSGFKFSDYNGGIWYDAGNDDLYVNGNHANSQVILQSGGSTALTLDSSQNSIFRGDILPITDSAFDIGSTTKYWSNIYADNTISNSLNIEGGELYLGEADTASGHINSYEVMTFNIDTDNDDTNRYFAWYKNGASGSGTELMRINEDGNVGIGTTTPFGILQLNVDSDHSIMRITAGDSSIAGIDFGKTSDIDDARIRYYNNGRYMQFFVANGERMRIHSNGRVSIGTTTASANTLTLSGTATEMDMTNTSTNGRQYRFESDSAGNFIIKDRTANADRILLDNTGKVKICNTGATNIGILQLSSSTNDYFLRGGANYGYLSYHTGGYHRWFGSDGAEDMRLDSSGRLGIGTSSPAEKLEVAGSVKIGNMKLENANAGRIGFNRNTSNGAIYSSSYAAFQINGASSGLNYLSFEAYNSSGTFQGQMVFTSSGNLGIGTTSPSQKLDVAGIGQFAGAIRITETGTSQNILIGNQDSGGVNTPAMINGVNGNLRFGRGNSWSGEGGTFTEVMRITSNDRVGIGTTAPSETLDVNGNIGVMGVGNAILFDTTGADSSNIIKTINDYETVIATNRGSAGFAVIGNSNIRLGFGTNYTNAQTDLFIENNGNVGIGTTSTISKLTVDGNGYIEGGVGHGYGNFSRIFAPRGAYYNGGSSNTGALTVILPQTGVNCMMRIKIRVFDYNEDESFDVNLAGYYYSGNNWTRTAAWIDCKPQINRNFAVRFGRRNSDGKGFISIGETNDTWQYVKFSVVEVMPAHSNASFEAWADDWSTTIITDFSPYTVVRTEFNTQANNWQRQGGDAYYVGSGKIGIGTSAPSYKLQVQKTSNAAPAFMVGGAYYGGPRIQTYGLDADSNAWMGLGTDMSGAPYEHNIYFSDYNSMGRLSIGTYNGTTYSEKMCVSRTGNVGIGEDNPESILHIKGGNPEIRVAASVDGQTSRIALTEDADGDTHGGYMQYVGGGDTLRLGVINSGTNTDVLTIKDNFRVGVGTINPSEKFSVAGNVAIDNGNSFMVGGGTGDTIVGRLKNTAGVLNLEADSGRQIRFGNGSQGETMRINAYTGSVGINNTAPQYSLDVGKNTTGVISRFMNNDGTYYPRIIMYGNSSGSNIQHTWSSSADNLIFHVGGSEGSGVEKMRITPTGIGMFTTSVDSNVKLDVAGAAHFESNGSARVLYLDAGSGNGNIIQFHKQGANKWEITGRDGTFYIYKNDGYGSGYRYQIDSNGNHTISGDVTFKNQVTLKSDNDAITCKVSRVVPISYQGASGYYDFDPVALFGANKSGGYILLEVNGWQTRFNAGYIHWRNDGSGSGVIGTGGVTYRQIAWSGSASGAGVTVSTVSSYANVIRISFSGWHSNAHGWQASLIYRDTD